MAAVTTFKTDEEASSWRTQREYGLSAAVQSGSRQRAAAVAARLESGMVHINDQTDQRGAACAVRRIQGLEQRRPLRRRRPARVVDRMAMADLEGEGRAVPVLVQSVREATFDVFREYGLTSLFANPGSTEISLLADLPDDLRFVLGLHEGSVVGMATGWAIGRGEPALAILHTTAGLGNAVGALATARVNRAPLVVIVGQQDRRHLASEPFLAGKLHGLAGDYPVWVDQPVHAQDVPGAVARAHHEAATASGPAVVVVPMDDWAAEADEPRGRAAAGRVVRSPHHRRRGCRAARRAHRRGVEPGARRRGRRRQLGDLGGARRSRRAARLSGLAGVLQRPGRVSPGPPSLRRPPPGRPDAPAQDTGSARRRARRRRAGVPSVPLRCRPVRRGRNAGGDDQPGCSRGASK